MDDQLNQHNNPPQLFKAYQAVKGDDSNTRENQGWLKNTSFSAKQVHGRFQESNGSNESSEDNDSLGFVDDICVPPAALKRKHEDSDSDESEEVPHGTEKVKRKKTKKEKKKKKKKKHKRENDKDIKEEDFTRKKTSERKHIIQPSGKVFIEDMYDLKPENAYRLERQSDPNNLAYQSIYKMHIARYYRATNSVLGLKSNQIVLFGKEKSKRHKPSSRYYGKENRGKKKSDDDEIVIDMSGIGHKTSSKFGVQTIATECFISIDSEDEKRDNFNEVQCHSQNPLGIYDPVTERYIEGKAAASKIPELLPSAKLKETDFQRIQRETAEFNKYLRDNPHDVEKWLKFIKFQEEAMLVKEIDPNHGEKKGKIYKALLDIKLSIVEKALEKNPASIELKKTQLLLGSDIWETSKITKEWKELTFRHPNNPNVWWHYLLFLQSNLNIFRVSTVVKAYGKCLSTLDSIRKGTLQSHGDLPHAEEHMIYFLEMLATFLKQSGHMERAVSIYQAMIEFNVFCPDILKQADKEKIDFLEAFWDSAVPRFGEDGATGWGQWVQSKGDVQFLSMYNPGTDEMIEEGILSGESDRPKTWLAVEKSRMGRHWLPWRPNVKEGETEEDCEDPERLIMFDDLSSLIFEIRSTENKLNFVVGLLSLLGHQGTKIFPSHSLLYQRRQQYGNESSDADSGRAFEFFHDDTFCPTIDFEKVSRNKFIENVFHQCIDRFTGNDKTRVHILWIQWKLRQLLLSEDDVKKDKKVWKSSCKELKKWIKAILKEEANRNNILLWDAYASVEEQLGNKEDSVNVVDTILSMNIKPGGLMKVTDAATSCQVYKLCRYSVETELHIRNPRGDNSTINKEKALHVLCSLVDSEQYKPLIKNGKVPPTMILRARKSYEIYFGHLMENDEQGTSLNGLPEAGSSLEHIVVCYAYFQYLTLDIQAASIVFQQCTARIKSKRDFEKTEEPSDPFDHRSLHLQMILEQLTEAHVWLLRYHIDVDVSPLSILRIPLQQVLLEYPDNVQLLTSYAELESRGGIRGQLRRRLHDIAKRSTTPAVWLSAVNAELKSIHRLRSHHNYMVDNYKGLPGFTKELPVESSTKHQLRAWFERALDQPQNRSCILVWRLYMYTEMEFGEESMESSIFYRAVQQCPRAKMIYLDFVHYFPGKLQEVVDLLIEKELRVRIPLEELDLLIANKENIDQNDPDNQTQQITE